MDDTLFELPFFDDKHRELAHNLKTWAAQHLTDRAHSGNLDALCRQRVGQLAQAGWLSYCVPSHVGGALPVLDSRSLCLIRQILAYHDGLADFSFAMQGLGSGPLSLFGSPEQQSQYLPAVADGQKIAAFALSEPDAGSDAAAMTTKAVRQGDQYHLHGLKTWISNAGIADFYTVFARTENDETNGVTAFVVDANTPGLTVSERFDISAPHPIGTLTFDDCVVDIDQRLGAPGAGFKVAMQTLDVFRASVGATALGFAQAAADMALERAANRQMFGATLADQQITQAAIGDMHTDIHAAALLIYRAAWQRDALGQRTTRSAAMAKLFATESAQRAVDRNVQIHGGLGVKLGHPAEMLYREIRALRIYEGATEVQQLVIARETMREHAKGIHT